MVKELIPMIVDTTLHYLLWRAEQNKSIEILTRSEEGHFINIREVSDGLPGELYTEDGWIARFSKYDHD